jgi:nucleoside-diphosphate-sugar epimerase
MKVLVVGGTGFIGKKIVAALLELGYFIRIPTRTPDVVCLPKGNIEYIKCDLIGDFGALDELVVGCSIIFNCAGELQDVNKMRALHVDCIKHLLDAAKNEARLNGRCLHWVQLSSVGAYGPPRGAANTDRVVTEQTPLFPVGEYEVTKTEADQLIQSSAEDGILSYSILRPSNVYGVDMPNSSIRQWGRLIKNRLFFYVGEPGAVSTYVHVDDVVSAMLLCASNPSAKDQIFNISNDCYQDQLVCSMAAALGVADPWMRFPEMPIRFLASIFSFAKKFPLTASRIDSLVARTRYPSTKLEEVLAYKPERRIEKTIAEVISGR